MSDLSGALLLKYIKPYVLGWISAFSFQQAGIPGGSAYAPTPHALSGIDHSGLLDDTQATQFLKLDGSRALTGNMAVNAGVTIDGVDISTLSGSTLNIINVLSYGATGDGTTDDKAAITSAINALPASGGRVYFPPGIYRLASALDLTLKSNVTYQGAGASATTIKPDSGIYAWQPATNADAERIAFEDMTFDMGGIGYGIKVTGNYVRGPTTIRRCLFYNPAPQSGGQSIWLQNQNNVTIEDCILSGPGSGRGKYIQIDSACHYIDIRRNRFLYFFDAIRIDSAAGTNVDAVVTSHVNVQDNYFDGAWWLLAKSESGSGGGVTYAATTLTDTGAAFTGASPNSIVRAMASLGSGTATCTRTKVTDTSATFTTWGVKRGQIIRVGATMGVIDAIESQTVLYVEEWLNDSDRQPASVPSGGYITYGIVIGRVNSVTSATVLSIRRWHDLDGNTVLPVANTYYELSRYNTNYPLHSQLGIRHVTITGNTFRRGWSDQCAVGGQHVVIANNRIEDGQDMGITIEQGSYDTAVTGNVIHHQGTAGLVVYQAKKVLVSGNRMTDSYWENTTVTYGCNIDIEESSDCLIIGNWFENITSPNGQRACLIYSANASFPSTNNTFIGNRIKGHLATDIWSCYGAQCYGNTFYMNEGEVVQTVSAYNNQVFNVHTAGSKKQMQYKTNTAELSIFDDASPTTGGGGDIRLQGAGATSELAITLALLQSYYINATAGAEQADFLIKTMRAGTLTEALRILASGYIGINDAAPHSTLRVNGSFATKSTYVSGTYTILATDQILACDSGTYTVTLPTPVNIHGRQYTIKKYTGSNTLTIATAAGNIDGVSTYTLSAPYDYVIVVSDGANWLTQSARRTAATRYVSAATTITDADDLIRADGGAYTVTLPTAVGRAGRVFTVKHLTTAAVITVAGDGSENIDGANTYALAAAAYASVTVQSDGTTWNITAKV